MFKNHFKIALRNLFLHKTFSFINILGLSIGVAAFIMVLLWIQNEFEYDQFHTNIDRLHRVMSNQSQSETEIFTTAATPGLLSKAIKEEVPEISMAVRTTWRMPKKLTYQNITAEERGYYVDSQFLKMFTFPLKQGEAEIALTAPENIVISQKLADKYFGDEMAIGNTLTVGDSKDYIVTGILEDIPVLSSLQFDFLLPFQAFEAENQWLQNWGENGIYTWTMLKKQANLDDASRKIATILTNNKRQRNSELILQPIKDMYLYTDFKNGKYGGGGKIKNVRLFGIIGFMIILIACVNFMNLSTARSRARAKEIGVRKVIGAQRSFLVRQFFIESFLMALIAVLLGLLLVDLCLPYFNNLASSTMHISYGQPMTWIVLLGVLTLTSLLSGSYPALVLSSLKPIEIFNKQFKLNMGIDYFRETMVVGQFTIAILLIIGTGVVFNQLRFMQQKDLGYNKEQLLYIPVKTEILQNNYTALKSHLEQLPEVLSVSSGSHHLSLIGSNTGSISWENKDPEQNQMFVSFGTNFDIIKTIDAELLRGRDFSTQFATDSMNFIINDAAAKAMGMDYPIGKTLSWGEDEGQIIGVVKDFHISPLKYSIDPAIMYIDPWRINHIFVKLETLEMPNALAKLEAALKTFNPNQAFEYEFASEEYAQFYQSEKATSQLSGIFSLLGIFICCLGLFGLALFTIEQRTQEIGIRKVLGATVTSIIGLLSKDFLKLVLLALVVALPIAWHFSNQWLQDFHYRIDVPWQLFLKAGGLVILIALLTVSTQSIRAALANPIQSLRNE